MPRYATSGPITIVPPGNLPAYRTEDGLTVDSVRNHDAFQFENYPVGSISLAEMARAFGADDVFVSVNPCWPFGTCRVTTGIPNQLALIEWPIFNVAAAQGHCFGIGVGIQRLVGGKESYRQFTGVPGAHAFDLLGPDRPRAALDSFLDAQHIKQFSDELIAARMRRPKSLQAQIDTIAREFSRQREPIVSIHQGAKGHAVLAYDMVQTASTADIYVYDSNRPFAPQENIGSGGLHRALVDENVIHIDKVKRTWSFVLDHQSFPAPLLTTWTGGEDGSLWAIPTNAVPDDPSLPGVTAAAAAVASVFGATSGSVRMAGSPGAEFSPSSDSSAAAPSGVWTSPGDRPLAVTFEGTRSGHYSQVYTAPGFVASVGDVETAAGVRDTVKGAGSTMTFAGGRDRPLHIQLAQQRGAHVTKSAVLDLDASAHGSDEAGFSGNGALTYAHDGAATMLSFALMTVRVDGGPSTFTSGPVAVRRGDRLRVESLGVGSRRVRLHIRDANGRTTTRILRSRTRPVGRVRLGAPKVAGRRLSMRLKLAGVDGRAVVGVTLRLKRGARIVARKALSLRIANGARTLVWRLPRTARGRYRLLASARALTAAAVGSAPASSVEARRSASVAVHPSR